MPHRGLTPDLAQCGEPLAQMWPVHFFTLGFWHDLERTHNLQVFKIILVTVIIKITGRPSSFGWEGWMQEAENRWPAGVSVVLLLCNIIFRFIPTGIQ